MFSHLTAVCISCFALFDVNVHRMKGVLDDHCIDGVWILTHALKRISATFRMAFSVSYSMIGKYASANPNPTILAHITFYKTASSIRIENCSPTCLLFYIYIYQSIDVRRMHVCARKKMENRQTHRDRERSSADSAEEKKGERSRRALE